MSVIQVQMKMVQMQVVQRIKPRDMQIEQAHQQRQNAQQQPKQKTRHVKIGPGHNPLLSGTEAERTFWSGFSTSSKRSASPGVSRISRISTRQRRESSCR